MSLWSLVRAVLGGRRAKRPQHPARRSTDPRPAAGSPVRPAVAFLAVAVLLAVGAQAGRSGSAGGSPSVTPTSRHVVSADLAVQAAVEEAGAAPADPTSVAADPTSVATVIPTTRAAGVAPTTHASLDPVLARSREWRDPGESPLRMVAVLATMAAGLLLLVWWLRRRAL